VKVTFLGTLPPIIGLSPYCLHLSHALSKKIDLEFLGFKEFSHKSRDFERESKIDETYYNDALKMLNIQNNLSWYNPFSGFKAGLNLKGDLLHLQWWISSLLIVIFPVLLLAKLKNIKIVISIHNILPHERGKLLLLFDNIANKLVFPFADKFIVHNNRNKDKLINLYDVDNNQISVITHGVFDLIKNRDIAQSEAKEHLKLPMDKKILLFFGYIRRYKGVDVLINAFASLQKEMDDILLLIVGQPIGENWEKYGELIKENHLEDVVKVELGFAPETEVEYYFSAADIVVLPYTYLDTHGGIGALALPFKKPLVVSDVGGLPEYVKDEQAIVKPNDVKDLYCKLKNILQDDKLRIKLSKDSADRARSLTWDDIANRTIEVYKRALNTT
jgi:glycosyltransferase involved in cell wall biosynthesis